MWRAETPDEKQSQYDEKQSHPMRSRVRTRNMQRADSVSHGIIDPSHPDTFDVAAPVAANDTSATQL